MKSIGAVQKLNDVDQKGARKLLSAPRENTRAAISDESIFETFTKNFADGLAIFGPDGKLAYVNAPFRKLFRCIDDALLIGISCKDLAAIGLTRGIWDLQGLTQSEWLEQFALTRKVGSTQHILKLTDGSWILRRETLGDDGFNVLLCSDLTQWKRQEDETNAALLRAERAELDSKLALRAEEARQNEQAVLSQLNHWLHSCKHPDELHDVVQAFLCRLLPGSRGILYTYNNSRDVLVPACSWNTFSQPVEIKSDDCWGLRQGRAYHYGHEGWRFSCSHDASSVHSHDCQQYFCIPILAHGETAGMLHIVPECDVASNGETVGRTFAVACRCAEQISLAIANVKLRQELTDQSTHDALTNLFNRRYFIERCAREFSKAKQTGRKSTIISIDLDHFKKFNDNFGHDAGDTVLKAFARLLNDHFRADDIVCRMGGEEFCVLLPGAPLKVGMLRAQDLLPKIQKMTVRYGNETLPGVTASAGVATLLDHGECLQDVLQAADTALYAAKSNGRNCAMAHQDYMSLTERQIG